MVLLGLHAIKAPLCGWAEIGWCRRRTLVEHVVEDGAEAAMKARW
jgi:hypothetical protein